MPLFIHIDYGCFLSGIYIANTILEGDRNVKLDEDIIKEVIDDQLGMIRKIGTEVYNNESH